MGYAWLLGAIACEVVATSLLKSTEGFSRPLPTALCLLGYGLAFAALAQAIKDVPVGVAYAMWSGIGTAAIVGIGIAFLGESVDAAKVGGVVLIIVGVVLLNLGGLK